MRTHSFPSHHRRGCFAAATVLFASLLTTVYAQNPNRYPAQRNAARQSWENRSFATLHKATAETEAFGISRLSGRPLRGASQEQFGVVTDFLLETQTGRIRYALVPSGAGSGGETYRLVPMDAVDSAAGGDGLAVRLNRDQWNRVGTMSEAELPGRVTLSPEQLQRYAQQFGLAAPNAAVDGDLTRATKWQGQAVRSGNDPIGKVADVVIDVPQRTAAALIQADNALVGAAQKFVVPFDRLQLTGDPQFPIHTTHSRNDFFAAFSTMSPTGQSSAAFGRGNTAINSTAAAVQQAIARDPSLANAGVQVIPEARLVLRGHVENEQKRAAIEQTARQAAAGLMIENQLTVQNR